VPHAWGRCSEKLRGEKRSGRKLEKKKRIRRRVLWKGRRLAEMERGEKKYGVRKRKAGRESYYLTTTSEVAEEERR